MQFVFMFLNINSKHYCRILLLFILHLNCIMLSLNRAVACCLFALAVEAAIPSNMLNRACQPKSQRAKLIRDAYLYAYDGYKEFAFGHDELLPVSESHSDSRYFFLLSLFVSNIVNNSSSLYL